MAVFSKESLFDHINIALRRAVDDAIEVEIEKAKASVEAEIRKSADQIALSVLGFYDVEMMHDRVIISVKKTD